MLSEEAGVGLFLLFCLFCWCGFLFFSPHGINSITDRDCTANKFHLKAQDKVVLSATCWRWWRMNRCNAVCCPRNICKHGNCITAFSSYKITANKIIIKHNYTFMIEYSICLFLLTTEENTKYISYIQFSWFIFTMRHQNTSYSTKLTSSFLIYYCMH